MRASERSRAAGEHFMPTIYVAADRRIFGVSVESYLLTEFISGTDVGKMPNWRERYGDACARCIAACHRYGIVHGDVHPGNFMVENETERVYVVDIAGKKATGISKAIDRMKCEKWFGIKNEIKDPGFRMAQFRIGWRAFRRRIFGKKD